MISRRDLARWFGAAAALTALPRAARALGPGSAFRFGQLQLGDWNPRPTALRRAAWEVQKRTSITVDTGKPAVPAKWDKLHETPLLYLACDREFPMPSPRDVERLRRFLTFGGMLLIDSAEGATGGAFDGSVRQLVQTLYPRPATGLSVVPKKHVLFKSFYLVDRPVGRVAVSGALEGVTRDNRLVIAYSQNDLGGAWARDKFGNYEFACQPGGERQREMAFRMAINVVMYAMCLDYKTDQVHVPFIMRRRRWRPNDGAEVAPGTKRRR